jgi:TetR/AcrR family transcriptional regulator
LPDGIRAPQVVAAPGVYLYYQVIIKVYFKAMQRKAETPDKVRLRRSRSDIREELLQSALVEFGAKGFDGASTRSIARRIEAHQPQINYHFESKAALWTAAVDYLFGLLGEALEGGIPAELTGIDVSQLASAFADGIRRFVRFAAEHPELNQIMVHEGTATSDRLAWMTETHVKPVFDGIRPAWQMLRKAGVAAPIDHEILYYVLVGAASLPYVNAPEVRLLTGRNPNDPKWIDAHAAALIAILLPGLAARAN